MQMDQIIYTNIMYLFIVLPIVSSLFILIAILLPKSKSPLERYAFQSFAIKIFIFIIGIRFVAFYLFTQTTNTESVMFLNSFAAILPIAAYTFLTFRVSQRLTGMGYNRFWGLLCAIPIIGPVLAGFLCVTIHERKNS